MLSLDPRCNRFLGQQKNPWTPAEEPDERLFRLALPDEFHDGFGHHSTHGSHYPDQKPQDEHGPSDCNTDGPSETFLSTSVNARTD